eukprot:TRINITY_DN13243_c0_g1_i1.p1 TRINITY_DN13243_c0_g1~~TRINITY_DN13243_c0_g1_i1.p1  ORF type:complete len:525 (-),score=105.42 TRINITY_DN13243_c0_g1_i1:292-1866(-)
MAIELGTILNSRWVISEKIGEGAFGQIYLATDFSGKSRFAIKVEFNDAEKHALKQEVTILKKLQDCPHVCKYIYSGRTDEFTFLVMTLLGDNLAELRKNAMDTRFSNSTTARIALQAIIALESIHAKGYIHRDVKPSNMAMGLDENSRVCYIIDFGLARRFISPEGELRPARESTGFRGTTRYASLNAHMSQDLGRRDDLMSLFYVIAEFSLGDLPWRGIKDKDIVSKMKSSWDIAAAFKHLPPEFYLFYEHVQSLTFLDSPDYSLIRDLFQRVAQRESRCIDQPFDWELPALSRSILSSRESSSSLGQAAESDRSTKPSVGTDDGNYQDISIPKSRQGSTQSTPPKFEPSLPASAHLQKAALPSPRRSSKYTAADGSAYMRSTPVSDKLVQPFPSVQVNYEQSAQQLTPRDAVKHSDSTHKHSTPDGPDVSPCEAELHHHTDGNEKKATHGAEYQKNRTSRRRSLVSSTKEQIVLTEAPIPQSPPRHQKHEAKSPLQKALAQADSQLPCAICRDPAGDFCTIV